MIQGTMSGAGKSLITAGLCRIFKQDGFRVCPFKSQNMALNSFVTKEGLELGRAQAVQAEAAGIEPSVLMNPILLKPTSDTGSQVIVAGRVRGNMSAREYFSYKKTLIPDILNAYHQLEQEYEIIVVEGAGSPAEINLNQQDIVNMGLAELLDAPVLLAGDIDRGGVFAQLAGTVMLLNPEEKARIRGMIINKFRGDQSILDPGVEMIQQMTKIPVVGVVPYMQVDIEEEDSMTTRFAASNPFGLLEFAVIRLPHISNFTDFAVLEGRTYVNLYYVTSPSQLGEPDMILLPGTKNTLGDLRWLRESGLEAAICRAKEKGCVVFGICGGYQMLGRRISDPEQMEEGGSMRGMELLPSVTTLTKNKTRTQVQGHLETLSGVLEELSGMALEGYEIHMGVSEVFPEEGVSAMAEITTQTGPKQEVSVDGCCKENVYGTYIHGIFDGDGIASALFSALAKKKGVSLAPLCEPSRRAYKETQYNLLADTLRSHLDMESIYRIMEGERRK
ncbi:MAG: cobyric acid synthase [Lachnospiraceae bacterium]|nr:cobyric acid synthase [Lachnospiraceae bacterium]